MKEKIKRGVGVLIERDGKILLGRRCEGWANRTWTLIGGKLGPDEKPVDGAKREAKEETSLEIDNLELITKNEDNINGTTYITFGFKPKIIKGEPKAMEPDEIERWEWFDLKKLPEPMYVPTKKMIEQYYFKKKVNECR
jgi:8-oxo-dGTP diphosphatase